MKIFFHNSPVQNSHVRRSHDYYSKIALIPLLLTSLCVLAEPSVGSKAMRPVSPQLKEVKEPKINLAPVFNPDFNTSTLPEANEGESYNAKIDAKDPEGKKLYFKLINGPKGLQVSSAGAITWKPDFTASGEYPLTIEASDGDLTSTLELTIKTNNTNRPPKLKTINDSSGKEAELFSLQLVVDDPDGDKVIYSLQDAPENMKVSESGFLEWLPSYEAAGKYTIQIRISDGDKEIGLVFTLVISENRRPLKFISQPIRTISENTAYAYEATVSNLDGQSINLVLKEGPPGMVVDNDIVVWFPDYKSAGIYPVVLEAIDKELTSIQSFSLTVEDSNRKPTIDSTPELTSVEGRTFEYQVLVADEDGDDLKISLKKPINGMTITNDLIQWPIGFTQQGKHEIEVMVSDGKDTASQKFTLDVLNTNREPNLAEIKNQKVVAGDKFTYELAASDIDHDKVKVNLKHAPEKMMLDNENNKISWRTEDKDIGTKTIIVSVSDGDLKVEKHFDITVVADD